MGSFDVFNHAVLPNSAGKDDDDNVWQPGGSAGWHWHPGHSLIIVTAGTVTDYESDDPQCKPHMYTVRASFVDEGGSHVHIIRNKATVGAQTIAAQLTPAGSTH